MTCKTIITDILAVIFLTAISVNADEKTEADKETRRTLCPIIPVKVDPNCMWMYTCNFKDCKLLYDCKPTVEKSFLELENL